MDYTNFFIASTGAASAFIGLLFVAISINTSDETIQQRRIIFAGSAFLSLIDAFFVSIISLTDSRALPIASIVMAVLALFSYYRLTRKSPWGNKVDVIYSFLVLGLYLAQLVVGLVYIHNPQSANLASWLVLIVIGLYIGALRRAWEITGVKHNLK